MLIVSQLLLLLSSVVGVFATSGWHYLVICLVWGVFYAMYSGLYEALVYDVLVEQQGHAKNFDRIYGRVGQVEGIALVGSSLLGAAIASRYTVHDPYIWTIPVLFGGLIAMLAFREPRIHEHVDEHTNFLLHSKKTIAAVRGSEILKCLLLVSVALGGTLRLLWEFGQLWYIAIGLPVGLFGIYSASRFLMLILRGWVVPRIRMDRFRLLVGLLLLSSAVTALLMIPNMHVVAVGLTILMFCAMSSELVLKTLQHDRLSSRIRAGAVSVMSTLAHLVFIPGGIIFGVLIEKFGIAIASGFVTVLLLWAAYYAFRAMKQSQNTTSV